MKKLSLVICVYNEEQNIAPLGQRILEALKGFDFEAIFVDDGSTDRTVKEIKKLNDDRFILVELKKNYGQSSALQAGIDYAEGEYIVTLDGDLQNDPADIPMMLDLAEREDWDLVAGVRANRQDGMFLRKIPSKIANYIIRNSTGVKMRDYGCTLKVFNKETAKSIHIYGELHRFIPVLASLEGARITQVDVHHHARQFGKSKYGIGRTSRVISDLLLMLFLKKYLQRPMHIFGGIGIITFFIGTLINLYMLVLKIMGHDIWGKPLMMLGIMLLLVGIQFITIGLLAEVMMRTYFESQNKTPYRIRRVGAAKEK
ncbi:MAG: glycosyltransferase family 2 protein [Bacteroidota bacterium]|nr:glycosyltransferase family 2 protein [Bacteroidota bacterium]MDP4205755.1 glycosyltransferase family 2 protein [Bacteroidota bacterium]